MNLRNDNPSDRVGPVFGLQRHIVTHTRTLPHQQVAGAFATLRASRDKPAVKLAFEFLVLTAVRPGEAWFGAWDKIDTQARVWAVPEARMKIKRDHRTPHSGRAVGVLGAARTLADGPLLFLYPNGRPLDIKVLRRLLERCGIDCLPHGFGSTRRPRKPNTRARWSRRRSHTRSSASSKQPTPVQT